ncbi:MAG: CYTH domain-containing protein [Kineosporiaceae bacterium]
MTQRAELAQAHPEPPMVVTEIEHKFDLSPGFAVPDLSDLTDGGHVGDPEHHDLDATYYDTADRRLLTRGITLRRRSGGADAGWHLKLPKAAGVRSEVRLPADARTSVPPALTERVVDCTAGAPLLPLARLCTRRTVRTLWDAGGRPLAELALDQVSAWTSAPDDESTWSELEVELVEGDLALLTAVGERLTRAGASAGRYPSKLARALDHRSPTHAPRPRADRPVRSPGPS